MSIRNFKKYFKVQKLCQKRLYGHYLRIYEQIKTNGFLIMLRKKKKKNTKPRKAICYTEYRHISHFPFGVQRSAFTQRGPKARVSLDGPPPIWRHGLHVHKPTNIKSLCKRPPPTILRCMIWDEQPPTHITYQWYQHSFRKKKTAFSRKHILSSRTFLYV